MNQLAKLSPELEKQIISYESYDVVIINDSSRLSAIDTIKEVKSIKSKIVEFFSESKDNAYRAWKAICANEKTFTDRLDMVEKKAKQAIITYDDHQAELRRKEQPRLQAIEDERARKEQERLMKKAEKLKTPERKEALMEEAATISAPVVQMV